MVALDCKEYWDESDLSQRALTVGDAVRESAQYACMHTRITDRPTKKISKPWFDKDCFVAKKQVWNLLKNCFRSNFDPQDKTAYIEQKRSYEKLLATKKDHFSQHIQDSFAQVKNSNQFWKALRSCKIDKSMNIGPSIEKWNNFYTKILPARRIYNLDLRSAYVEELDHEITF